MPYPNFLGVKWVSGSFRNSVGTPEDRHAQISRRLFDANDPEWTGITRFWPESLDDQLPCGTTEDRN
jgi:hypothetical protein